ncbi:DNA-binding transcriptional LysR family regulator [Saccharomonospora amisosensis]|uniref:DNA-binding transcriptional LysR family regulator n=1 Tax=Saccharomonospora amisosensis TaxID=1128677 RepID=A0A7X5ZRH6_9PSEU|nr:LysR family transcriptional regulator [Saccharomonospora amisosensis]NIJ12536.1 DNA-binding transcriptional LysR family regulator [Saccharomonospora amisosensis]
MNWFLDTGLEATPNKEMTSRGTAARRPASLASLDLNLLVFLRELLRERNVTRAAQRVGVSQPTASAALSRLRRHFNDQLLIRSRGAFTLSPLAVQLAMQVEPVCAGLERLFSTSSEFDPLESEREFKLLTVDYVLAAFGEQLSREMYQAGPKIRLYVQVVKQHLPSDPLETLRVIDGMISAPKAEFRVPGIRSLELFRDRWVCLVDRNNPVSDHLRLSDLERLPWVVPHHPDGGYPPSSPLGPLMARLGTRPKVAVRVDSYQATPYFVAGTDRIAIMQRRLARLFANRADLRVLECPGDPPPIVETLWWHEQKEHDEGHKWWREAVERAARRCEVADGVGRSRHAIRAAN